MWTEHLKAAKKNVREITVALGNLGRETACPIGVRAAYEKQVSSLDTVVTRINLAMDDMRKRLEATPDTYIATILAVRQRLVQVATELRYGAAALEYIENFENVAAKLREAATFLDKQQEALIEVKGSLRSPQEAKRNTPAKMAFKGRNYQFFVCPECEKFLCRNFNYCPECGQRVFCDD